MDKKKLIYILTAVMGVIVVIIGVVALLSSSGNKTLSFEAIENQLKSATQTYFKKNSNSLPSEEGMSVTVDSSTLVNGGYMKQLSDMVKKGVDCSGKVIVTKNGSRYLYSPILNCGDSYQTKKLVDVVRGNNPIVNSGNGLYLIGESSKFKGEYVNNYVKIDNFMWRIIDIDNDGFIRLIYADKANDNTYIWDDRYNIDQEENVGINNYEVSRLRETMMSLENNDLFVSEDSKANLAYRNICIGKRSIDNLALDNKEECEMTVSNQLFGLPYTSDYLSASIDDNCHTIKDASCKNYNYLMSTSLSSWTLTGQKEKTYKAYSVSRSGYSLSDTYSEKAIRPTVYLSNNTIYKSGNGTSTDPYIIKK